MLAPWSIGTRIYAGFAIVLVRLTGLAAFTFTSMNTVTGLFDDYRATARQTIYVNDLAANLFRGRMAVMKYRAARSDEGAAEVHDNLAEMLESMRLLDAYFAGDEQSQSMLRPLAENIRVYDDAFTRA